MIVHMLRVFFTGAFRKPREINWLIGVVLLTLGSSRASPATRCPTTCCPAPACGSPRACCCRMPVVGTYLSFFLFGGEFPGDDIIPRLYIVARAADPGHHPGADHRAPDAGLVPEAHPVPGPGPDREQRGRLPVLPGLHGQGRRLLLHRLRRDRAAVARSRRSTRSGCSGPTRRPRSRPARSPTATWASSRAPADDAQLGDPSARASPSRWNVLGPGARSSPACCSRRWPSIRSSSAGSPATTASTTSWTGRATCPTRTGLGVLAITDLADPAGRRRQRHPRPTFHLSINAITSSSGC